MIVEVHDGEHGHCVLVGLIVVEGGDEAGELLFLMSLGQMPAGTG